jgi:hypothetical protein
MRARIKAKLKLAKAWQRCNGATGSGWCRAGHPGARAFGGRGGNLCHACDHYLDMNEAEAELKRIARECVR